MIWRLLEVGRSLLQSRRGPINIVRVLFGLRIVVSQSRNTATHCLVQIGVMRDGRTGFGEQQDCLPPNGDVYSALNKHGEWQSQTERLSFIQSRRFELQHMVPSSLPRAARVAIY